MITKSLIAAVAIALTSGAAQAAEKNAFTKEEGVGGLTGAAAGAFVGGPVGAAVGFLIGGIIGDNMGIAKRANLRAEELDLRAQMLEQDLIDTRIELAKASERNGGDQMFDELAQRLHADVMFRTGRAELDAQAIVKLAELGRLMGSHQTIQVKVHGFADPRGDAEENLELSMQRADAVRQALIDGGATPEQIELSAHGEDLTTAPDGDLEAYAWERRVTLSIQPSTDVAVARAE
jgi:outer membrane protein OmpA-like peptidoglycan-associated protein